MPALTILNNTQGTLALVVSKNRSTYPDGVIASGYFYPNTTSGFILPAGDLYQVGINSKYGYNMVQSVPSPGTVAISASLSSSVVEESEWTEGAEVSEES